MAHAGGNDGLMADINVTPLVDVMLVLLIIFMVTAPMMTQGVDVALPETTGEAIDSQKEPLIVSVDRNNDIFIGDFKVPLAELREKLKKILESRKDGEVLLRADKTIPYGMVVQVMAEAKAAGIEKLGMVTDPTETKSAATKKK
jgi:biopolymer transport protein TolR